MARQYNLPFIGLGLHLTVIALGLAYGIFRPFDGILESLSNLAFGPRFEDVLPNLLITANTATFLYAYMVYVEDVKHPVLKVVLLVALISLAAVLRYSHSHPIFESGKTPSERDVVNFEFLLAIFMNLFFFIIDFLKSSKSTDASDWHSYFAAWYISAPTFISLVIAYAFYYINGCTDVGWRPGSSISYLSGVAFIIVLMSNLVFGLLAWPRWAKRLRVELTGESWFNVTISPYAKDFTMRNILITAFCATIVGLLAALAAITVTFLPGVAALYPASAFEAAFGVWFGPWGAVASYIGLLVAGSLSGWFSILTGLILALSDLMLSLFTGWGMRRFKVDPALPTTRDALAFFAIALAFGSVPSSIFYNLVNLQLGVLAGPNSFWVAVAGWNIGNAVIFAIVGIPLMKLGTPTIRKLGFLAERQPRDD